MRFSFIGELDYNSESSKVPYLREITGGLALSLISIEAKNNRAFVEMSGFKNDPIKTKDNDGEDIEIAWDDRFDEDSLKKVASYRKHVITVEDVRKEFISELDFIGFVRDNIADLKGKRFQITGQTRVNEYKGKITDRFRIQSMYEVDDSKKNELRLNGDFFFNKESIDTADFAKERKIYLNGWTFEYVNKEVKNRFVAKQLVFDCSKLNFEDEKHIAILNYKLKQIGCAYEDGKIATPKLKKNKYYKIEVICKYLNGQETVEFSEKDLTENQKQAVQLGLASLDDFRPKGQIYGARVEVYKLVNFDLRGDYVDGCIEAEDFSEDLIYTPSENESVSEAFKEDAMNPPEEETTEDDSESLFD